jgi:hypothetical protein
MIGCRKIEQMKWFVNGTPIVGHDVRSAGLRSRASRPESTPHVVPYNLNHGLDHPIQ